MPILSNKSRENLEGVAQPLIDLAYAAIKNTPVDFRVTEGIRTVERQTILVRSGASRTMDSKHIHGYAIDVVPWIEGAPRYHWPLIFKMVEHIRDWAQILGIGIVWGGSWNQNFTNTKASAQYLQARYIDRCKNLRKIPFLDGPHIELAPGEIKKLTSL